MTKRYHFELDSKTCLFCGACASLAPNHFFVDPTQDIARVTQQPQNDEDAAACRAAMINCPASAIRETVLNSGD